MGDQHDHHRVGARKVLGLAARAVALPAAFLHPGAGAAIGAEAVALMPAYHRFRHRDRGELLGRSEALHRHAAQFGDGDVSAAHQLFHGRGRNTHAEQRRAVAQAQKDRAWIGAEFQRLIEVSSRRGPSVPASPPASRGGSHRRGRCAPFQRQQFVIVAAQMRGAVENVGDESGLPQRKQIECSHGFNQARSCGEAR